MNLHEWLKWNYKNLTSTLTILHINHCANIMSITNIKTNYMFIINWKYWGQWLTFSQEKLCKCKEFASLTCSINLNCFNRIQSDPKCFSSAPSSHSLCSECSTYRTQPYWQRQSHITHFINPIFLPFSEKLQ